MLMTLFTQELLLVNKQENFNSNTILIALKNKVNKYVIKQKFTSVCEKYGVFIIKYIISENFRLF